MKSENVINLEEKKRGYEMFKEGKFYYDKKSNRAIAILGSVTQVYYPYLNQDKNLIAQFDDSRIVLINFNIKQMKSVSGLSEKWKEIKEGEWDEISRFRWSEIIKERMRICNGC